MNFATIASGSSGNSILVRSEGRSILVDDGISLKKLKAGLQSFDLSPDDLDGIFITHEHSDHIGGLKVLLKKHQVPIYLTEGTYKAIIDKHFLGDVNYDLFNVIKSETQFKLGDLAIEAFDVSHDAAEPVIYRFENADKSMAIVTDLGKCDDALTERLSGLDAVLLEANHDVRMLQLGPYPYHLKKRILGEKGHLSNETAAGLITKLNNKSLKNVVLGHLSKENNYVDLAYETARVEMEFNEMKDVNLSVAPRENVSQTIEI